MRPDWMLFGFIAFCVVMMTWKKLRPDLEITREREVLLFYNWGYSRNYVKLFRF